MGKKKRKSRKYFGYNLILPDEQVTSANLDSFSNLYFLGAAIMALPFITLLFNRKETKGKTLEEINN